MERIDFTKLTQNQRDVLGAIAVNQDGGHARSTLKALVKKGLIEELVEIQGEGIFKVWVNRYRVPIPVHIQWCEWCSETVKDDETA